MFSKNNANVLLYAILALNFYRYKTFVTFKSVTFEFFGDDANSVFHEDQKFSKSITFEIFEKCLESVNFDTNNDLQEDL